MSFSPTVLVTGAASGVGAATVHLLEKAGARVIAADIQPIADGITLDLGDPPSIEDALNRLPDSLDSVVNVAGIPGPEPAVKVMQVNFLGVRLLIDSLFDRVTDGGTIVTVSSEAGRGWRRRAEVVNGLLDTESFDDGVRWCEENRARWAKDPYTFSKQCMSAWTQRLAGRGRDRGVRANCVSPGPISSALSANFRDQIGAEQFDWRVGQVGRMATPEEVAEVIEFFAVGRCGWVNGVDLVIDGGMEAGVSAGWIDLSTAPNVGVTA